MKKVLPVLALLFLLTSAFLNTACDGLDDNGLFDEANADTVSVQAYLTHSLDSSGMRFKADTLLPTDSIILIATISPSKSIRMQDYFWQMDSKTIGYDFSFKTHIQEPGHHTLRFVILDRFGDTLSDTLSIWVSRPPVLNDSEFIPADSTQNIDISSGASFAWAASDSDAGAHLSYHFLLEDADTTYADTLLDVPYFHYSGQLPNLQKMEWEVSAADEFGFLAKDTLRANFYTAGIGKESAIFASVSSGADSVRKELRATISNESGKSIFTDEEFGNSGDFRAAPLSAGKYKLYLYNPRYPDYRLDTIAVTLAAGESRDLGKLSLTDTIAPVISAVNTSSDSLASADTLKFSVTDGGGTISNSLCRIYLNGSIYSSWTISNDTLRVAVPSTLSIEWQPLRIQVYDNARNFTKHTYYIEPDSPFISTLPDILVATSDSAIDIPITNIYAGLTPRRFYWDIDTDGSWDMEAAAGGMESASQRFILSLFKTSSVKVTTAIGYTNGILAKKSFTLTINHTPVTLPTDCISPCNDTISAAGTYTFSWHPATDADDDSLHYKVLYHAGASLTFPDSEWVYAADAGRDTTATVTGLPSGSICWWVRVTDDRGGISAPWNPPSLIFVSEEQ